MLYIRWVCLKCNTEGTMQVHTNGDEESSISTGDLLKEVANQHRIQQDKKKRCAIRAADLHIKSITPD